MGSRYEVEVTVGSARDLKNVNWRNGELKPYVVLWVDSEPKVSTRVDLDNGESPSWDDAKALVPLPPACSRMQDAVLYLDVVHANAAQGVKPLVGSARVPLRDVLDDGGKASRSLKLKRPSGRPQGRLEVRVAVREPSRYYDSGAAGGYPPPAGYPGAVGAYGGGGYGGAAPGGYGAGAAAVGGYGAPYTTAAHPSGYPAAYGSAPAYGASYGAAPPAQAVYGSAAQPAYGASTTAYVDPAKKKKAGLGVGGGLAVGAAAGVLGGLALAGGASYLEDKFEDEVAERVEEDQYDGGSDDYGGGDDGDY